MFEILLQCVLNFFEWQSVRRMKMEGMDGDDVHPLSEEDKRKTNYMQSLIYSILGLILFFLFMGLGLDKIKGRMCPSGQGLDGGICLDCVDKFCNRCDSNINRCESCNDGSYLFDGKCIPCDPDGGCSKCDS